MKKCEMIELSRELVKNKDFIELKKFVNNYYVVDTYPRDFNE